jgi:hypothetical protein
VEKMKHLIFLIKQLAEAAFAAEIDSHLTQDLDKNHKNGYSTKTYFWSSFY